MTGVIELQDIIKPGIQERFERLRKMGVKTVMVTGDNPLTAKYIAEKAGVDDFIAEAKPEDKMEYIKCGVALGPAWGATPQSAVRTAPLQLSLIHI